MMLPIYQNSQPESFMASWQNKFYLFLLCLLFTFLLAPQAIGADLKGRILLQVQEKGEAWYVNPINGERYYLGRPEDAFEVMRSFGLGVLDKDIGNFQLNRAPSRLAGRILLQVQDKGQAFYVNPIDLKLYYLGRPQDAFYVMRSFGLGISNSDLVKIKIDSSSPLPPNSHKNISLVPESGEKSLFINDFKQSFNFKYKNESYLLNLNLSSELYNYYRNLQKNFSFPLNSDLSIMRNIFYGNFLSLNESDQSIKNLLAEAKKIAQEKSWNQEELLEFLLAFIQYIPYDNEKVLSGSNINPFFPYETLYLNKGVCSDKTFLALVIARELNYGAAILDFPEINHSALGLACPKEDSIRNSGYCFLETTNYFPPGVIPLAVNEGQAEGQRIDFSKLFVDSDLGKMEIYQETTGQIYQGVSLVKKKAEEINLLNKELNFSFNQVKEGEETLSLKEKEINDLKEVMDAYLESNKIKEYNALIPNFNSLINDYNNYLADYKEKISNYNQKATSYNFLINSFYQK